jgi:hypothetical protein
MPLNFFRNKISWEWEFGIDRHNEALYCLTLESNAVKDKVFLNAYRQFVKKLMDSDLANLQVGQSFEVPKEMIKHNSMALMFSLPEVKPKDEKLLTKELKEIKFTRVIDGWKIKLTLEGVRRVY